MSNVQISAELFARLYAFHVLGKTDALNARIIADMIEEKAERMQKRQQYADTLKTR